MALVNQTIITKTAKETQKLGEKTAKKLLKKGLNKVSTCVCLVGDLGAGKTTFAKGFALGLGIKEVITSPTFIIMRNYKLKTINYKRFYHIDGYRLKGGKDVEVLGLKDILSCPTNIILIEWPNNSKGLLPNKKIEVVLKHPPLQKSKTSQSLKEQQNQQNTSRTIDISNSL